MFLNASNIPSSAFVLLTWLLAYHEGQLNCFHNCYWLLCCKSFLQKALYSHIDMAIKKKHFRDFIHSVSIMWLFESSRLYECSLSHICQCFASLANAAMLWFLGVALLSFPGLESLFLASGQQWYTGLLYYSRIRGKSRSEENESQMLFKNKNI